MLSLPRFLVNPYDFDVDYFPHGGDLLSLGLAGNNLSQQQHRVRNELAGPRVHGDKFNFNLNMRQFDPSEISVKFDKNQLTVHGKREKKGEDGSYVFREYKQMCTVPENVLHDQMKCRLDDNGFLRIEAPIKQEEKKNQERHIPIEFVGSQQPALKK